MCSWIPKPMSLVSRSHFSIIHTPAFPEFPWISSTLAPYADVKGPDSISSFEKYKACKLLQCLGRPDKSVHSLWHRHWEDLVDVKFLHARASFHLDLAQFWRTWRELSAFYKIRWHLRWLFAVLKVSSKMILWLMSEAGISVPYPRTPWPHWGGVLYSCFWFPFSSASFLVLWPLNFKLSLPWCSLIRSSKGVLVGLAMKFLVFLAHQDMVTIVSETL